MTVNSEDTPRVQYTANSITTIFPITFVYDDISDVHVYFISNSTGLATAWTKDASGPTGYTVSAGAIVANTAPSNGYLVAVCTTPVTQLVDVKPNRALTADTLEGVFDKLTLIGRDLKGSVSRALIYGPTYTGSIPYAEDLADEIKQDSVDASVAAVNALTFATSLHIDNLAALRLFPGVETTSIYLDCHTSQLDGGHGAFDWDADSTAPDNNGTVIQVTGVATGRWIRQTNGFITPEMFGGDIQSCLDIGGKIVIDKAYTITDQLEITEDGTKLIGSGSITFSGSMVADNIIYADSVDGIKISGIDFIGDHTNEGTDTTAAAIYLNDCDNFIIEKCEISEFSRFGLIVVGGSDFKIINNKIHDIKYATSLQNGSAIAIRDDATGYSVCDNIVATIGNNAYGGNGIGIGVYSAGCSSNFRVTGNTVKDIYEHGILVYNGVTNNEDLDNADISGNIVENTGLSDAKARGNGIYLINVGGFNIDNNQLRNTNTNTPTTTIIQAAIAIAGYAEGTHQSVTITNNRIDGTGLHSAIFIQKHQNVTIANNNILNATTKRALVIYRCTDFTVTGNTLEVAADITAISFGGDSALLPCKNGSASDNAVNGGLYGINCTFGESIILNGNSFRNNASTAILLTNSTGINVTNSTTTVADQISLSMAGCTNSFASGNNFVRYTAVTWPRISISTSTGCWVDDWCTTTPTAAAFDVGSYLRNRASTVGQPKGWYCTTPGTWVSEGSL